MAYSTQSAVSDGTLSVLPLSIDYLSRDDITVYFGSAKAPSGSWSWVGTTDKTITFAEPVAYGVTVTVKRSTKVTELYHRFGGGTQFTSKTLDESLRQTLFVAQEFAEVGGIASDDMPLPVGGQAAPGFSNKFARADHVHVGMTGGSVGSVTLDTFSGDGATTQFDLSNTPTSKGATQVYVGGAYQEKAAYTVTGNKLTLTEAPESGAVVEVITVTIGGGKASDVQVTETADLLATDTGGNLQGALSWLAKKVKPLAGSTGASLVGFLQAGTGAVLRTVQDKLRDRVHVKDFGAVCDGTTDDTAALQRAINSGAKFVDATAVEMRILGPVDIASNQVVDFRGSTISTIGDTTTVLRAIGRSDWSLVQPRIVGDLVVGPGTGTGAAIYVEDCVRFRVSDATVQNFRGHGIRYNPGASASGRSNHGFFVNPRIDACYIGWKDDPGSGAEYVTILNPMITACSEAGMQTAAGNVRVVGGHVVDNVLDGVVISGGSNHAHGGFVGVNINHNSRYNLHAKQVLNGETLTGCHFYGNGSNAQGAIFLDRSKGISISGGHLDCQIYNYKDAGSGMNVIENMYCPGSYGVARLGGGNDGHSELIIRGCYGPGVYALAGGKDDAGTTINDPSLCYAYADRGAGSTQALTNGVSTTLTWSRDLLDRREAFNPATGVFAVPAGQAGMYRVALSAVFNGTAMSATSSYVDARVNGVSKKFCFLSAYSTTKLATETSFDIYLNAGDAVSFTAVIAGTSPTFGDSAVVSFASFSRIA